MTGWPCVCISTVTGGVSCNVSAAWYSCVAAHWSKYHCYEQALSRCDLRCPKAKLNPKQTSMIDIVKINGKKTSAQMFEKILGSTTLILMEENFKLGEIKTLKR